MKKLILISFLLSSILSFSQKEGQSFCDGENSETYFPISISKKKIIWQNTFYFEANTGTKTINGKTYTVFDQIWENKERYTLYLREENGQILQYEDCCDEETIRFDSNYKKGDTWKSADKNVTYTIESLTGTLKTPYCEYKNLLVLKSEFTNGTFTFYYLKGYGYVGATINNQLISFASPE